MLLCASEPGINNIAGGMPRRRRREPLAAAVIPPEGCGGPVEGSDVGEEVLGALAAPLLPGLLHLRVRSEAVVLAVGPGTPRSKKNRVRSPD